MNSILSKSFLLIALAACSTKVSAATDTRQALQKMTVAVRASYSESGHGLAAINDGATSTTSPYWSCYRGDDQLGQWEYVEYAWATRCVINRAVVNWVADGSNIKFPAEAYFAVWDGHEWSRALDLKEPNGSGASSNTGLELETNRLRIYMRSDAACGIREFTVQGYPLDDCGSPTLTSDLEKVTIKRGETVELSAALTIPGNVAEEPNWYWLDEQGEVTSTDASMTVASSGFYTLCYERPCGAIALMTFTVSIDGEYDERMGYQWPSYSPTLDYDFRSEYPSLPAPTKGRLPENVNVAKQVDGEWWSVAIGPKANPLITEESMRLLAKKMDEDFAYFRNEMGWPPDKRARNGYYSQVNGYGSGLSFDSGTPNTATGGWQSATNYQGSSWPMVFLSYYPIYSFDPSCTYGDRIGQQNACVHEGIHATFADLEGCKNASWFHEAGNTWLQAEAEVRKSGRDPESMGFLSAGNMIAPFMPIECYSGWLQDDSFGGPAAEGVNMYGSDGQICTWRNLLGGVQYGELFPHVLNAILGKGAVPWIWRYCKSRVLEGMAKGVTENGKKVPGLGEQQMRHLIVEYRARQAMIDIGKWSKACEALIDNNWLITVKGEKNTASGTNWIECDVWRATPYTKMTAIANPDSADWYKPEWRTTPGWSGANQIPLHTSGRAGDRLQMTIKAFSNNMVFMLCYRTAEGKIYYSQPVNGRRNRDVEVSMLMPEAPANGVVLALVINTDYIYAGEQTRKTHHKYHIRMGQNVWKPASPNYKWYKYAQTIKDSSFDYTGIDETPAEEAAEFALKPARNVVRAGERLPIVIAGADRWQVPVQIVSASGAVAYQQSFVRDGDLEVPASLRPGIYILRAISGNHQAATKLFVK